MLFPPSAFPEAPHLDTKKALLLIDFQNDFVDPDGSLHVGNIAGFLPKLPLLVSKFRDSSGEIIWAQTQFTAPQPTISPELGSYVIVLKEFVEAGEDDAQLAQDDQVASTDSGPSSAHDADPGAQDPEAFLAPRLFSAKTPRCCLPGFTGFGLPVSLSSAVDHEKDLVLLKSRYSAFDNTSLLMSFRKKLITELYLCGSLSNVSVYATALDAVRHGMSVTIVEDCVGYRTEMCHQEAMRQMADAMGVNGVDCQELIDDLNGDLGEVITNDTFPHRFDVRLSTARKPSDDTSSNKFDARILSSRLAPDKSTLRPRVQEWMSNVDGLSAEENESVLRGVEERLEPRERRSVSALPENDHLRHFRMTGGTVNLSNGPNVQSANDLSKANRDEPRSRAEPILTRAEILREDSPTSLSPPRKRSTGELDFEEQDSKVLHAARHRRLSHETPAISNPKMKTNRVRVRRRQVQRVESTTSATNIEPRTTDLDVNKARPFLVAAATAEAASMPNLAACTMAQDDHVSPRCESVPNLSVYPRSESVPTLGLSPRSESVPIAGTIDAVKPQVRKTFDEWRKTSSMNSILANKSKHLLGKESEKTSVVKIIGEGDSRFISDLTSEEAARHIFDTIKNETAWQKMYHRSGEVPRLVAVQGEIGPDGSIPIYRHPADESPRLLPFSSTIQTVRESVERILRHPVNHVLIQLYRSGEDNISEHSDKTLDIVPGSDIVNISFGAQRTLILRAKKSAPTGSSGDPSQPGTLRTVQRVPLLHNSTFILGQKTNQYWLHAIRADKRRLAEKSTEELDFGGERISLTFRRIGTFVDPLNSTIWGLGATEQEKHLAKIILAGPDAELVGELMIQAFGQENHQSHAFQRQVVYGSGFDVVNFVTKDMSVAT